jgi:hypothetical protein
MASERSVHALIALQVVLILITTLILLELAPQALTGWIGIRVAGQMLSSFRATNVGIYTPMPWNPPTPRTFIITPAATATPYPLYIRPTPTAS